MPQIDPDYQCDLPQRGDSVPVIGSSDEELPRWQSRAALFIRSLLPAQSEHLLFLIGTILLYAAAFASWISWRRLLADMPSLRSEVQHWTLYAALPMRILLSFASLSALWICFTPVNRPRRAILTRVLGTASLSLAWFSITIVRLFMFGSPRSILETAGDGLQRGLSNLSRVPPNLGAGFYFGLLGFLLLAAGFWRLTKGLTTLPVRFGMKFPASCREESCDSTRAVLVFVSIVLVLPFALDYLFGFIIVLLPNRIFHAIYDGISWFGGIDLLISSSAPALGALYMLRDDLKAAMRQAFDLSRPRYYGWALGIPVLAVGLPRLAFFYGARWFWGTGAVSPDEAPPLHMLSTAWLVILLLAALLEEIGWRGYLQPILVRQFGVRRGIFLVGLVWSGYHFAADLNGKSLLGTAFVSVAERLAFCLAFATVLGWLRLQSGSILPVALLHASNNILNWSIFAQRTAVTALRVEWITLGTYAVIGYLLFQYRPRGLNGVRNHCLR